MNQEKVRTVVTTDGEIDDINSFIRLLLYSNDLDIAGIILTSSMFHYSGNDEKAPYRWTGTTWIPEMIDRYAAVYPNLVLHDSSYPTPQELKAVYRTGNISDVSEMEEETEGSNFLVDLILDDDERPLYIQTWGGTNTTARALKTIQERYQGTPEWPHIKAKVEAKVILYIILDQDGTYSNYIAKNWNLTTLNDSIDFGYFAYGWKSLSDDDKKCLDATWQQQYVRNKGALLEQYALIGDGYYLEGEIEAEQFGQNPWLEAHPDYDRYDFISEGDSLSYFYLLNAGLRGVEAPSYGGWGGRFREVSPRTFTSEKTIDYNPNSQRFEQEYAFIRWIPDIQADFAARANWCVVDSFNQATHYPLVELDQENLLAKAGATITLNASASDPNNLPLTYRWWCYYEASSYWDFSELPLEAGTWKLGEMEFVNSWHSGKIEKTWTLSLQNEETASLTVTIPSDAKPGDTFHLVLEVANQAELPLKSYKRVIVTVEENE